MYTTCDCRGPGVSPGMRWNQSDEAMMTKLRIADSVVMFFTYADMLDTFASMPTFLHRLTRPIRLLISILNHAITQS